MVHKECPWGGHSLCIRRSKGRRRIIHMCMLILPHCWFSVSVAYILTCISYVNHMWIICESYVNLMHRHDTIALQYKRKRKLLLPPLLIHCFGCMHICCYEERCICIPSSACIFCVGSYLYSSIGSYACRPCRSMSWHISHMHFICDSYINRM